MNLTGKLNAFVRNPLATFQALQITIAAICIFIPVVLRLSDVDTFYPGRFNGNALTGLENCSTTVAVDSVTEDCHGKPSSVITVKRCDNGSPVSSFTRIAKDRFGYRNSMSDYAYSTRSYYFGMMYCLAAMMFIFNGAVYVNRQQLLRIHPKGHWYNIFIGVFLLGVVCFPQCDNAVMHYVFTVLFFAGNLVAMAFFPNPGETAVYRIIRKCMVVLILAVLAATLIWHAMSVLWAEWFSLTVIAVHLILVMLSARRPA